MKIRVKEINYQKGFSTGPFLQEKPGFVADVELEEGEDERVAIIRALWYLRGIALDFHKESNPHLGHSVFQPEGVIQTTRTEQAVVDEEFMAVQSRLELIKNYEDAFLFLNDSAFRYHPLLKNIVESKKQK